MSPPALVDPVVVPRWEWRTFGDLENVNEFLAALLAQPAAESEETYLLSRYSNASVKVRDGLLDTKALRQVTGTGLELWVPTMKAGFPLDGAALAATFDALGLPPSRTPEGGVSADVLLEELLAPRDELRAVRVGKSRHRSRLDDCIVEITDLVVDGAATIRTVAAESSDPELVTATVSRLGLAGRANTCVSAGLKSLLGWHPRRYAVLDVGTNSVKFILGERGAGGPHTEADTAVVTRLGEGLAEAGELTPPAMRRTVDAIAGLVEDARRSGPIEIVAVGTAGLRQAPNRDDFVAEVFARCGVAVEVISGRDEARLAYLAATADLLTTGDALLVFDSGGGSSQFTWGSSGRIDEQFSLDVGAVQFTERFGLAHAVPRDTVGRALAAITAELGPLQGRSRPDMVIAIGGTSTNLAAVQHGLLTYDPDVVHGTLVDLAEVDRQIESYRTRTADERRGLPGLQPARAEVILAGACIVRCILTLTGQDAVTVSDRGLRHGVVAEKFGA